MSLDNMSLRPESWPKVEIEQCVALSGMRHAAPARSAEGSHGVVAGTTGPLAVYAGLQTLKAGGSAADAALVTSLMQICLATGGWVSYAGIMSFVYYDAATDSVFALDAGFNTLREETDPASIPAWDSPSGRTALVPGYMAGVEAAHGRFGSLPFNMLFEPAVHFADAGIPLIGSVAEFMENRKQYITRLPAARAVFTKRNGDSFRSGETFRQPLVAETLRGVAAEGSAYMYTGVWANRLVDAVRAEGGQMTLDDLASYTPLWTDPTRATYGEYEIAAPGAPGYGAVYPIEALNLAECAGYEALGPPSESADALHWLIQITRQGHRLNHTLEDGRVSFASMPLAERLTKTHAKELWKRMYATGRSVSVDDLRGAFHSDAVVACDERGNLAALTHSINSLPWGHSGIVVDGVAIPDSAALYQDLIAETGPGNRLPQGMHPLVVTKHGKPFLASSTIGASGHETTTTCLLGMLEFGMDPANAATQPAPLMPALGVLPGVPMDPEKQMVVKGDFEAEVLEGVRERGQDLIELEPDVGSWLRGFWVGLRLDPETGARQGAATAQIDGYVAGY